MHTPHTPPSHSDSPCHLSLRCLRIFRPRPRLLCATPSARCHPSFRAGKSIHALSSCLPSIFSRIFHPYYIIAPYAPHSHHRVPALHPHHRVRADIQPSSLHLSAIYLYPGFFMLLGLIVYLSDCVCATTYPYLISVSVSIANCFVASRIYLPSTTPHICLGTLVVPIRSFRAFQLPSSCTCACVHTHLARISFTFTFVFAIVHMGPLSLSFLVVYRIYWVFSAGSHLISFEFGDCCLPREQKMGGLSNLATMHSHRAWCMAHAPSS